MTMKEMTIGEDDDVMKAF